MGQEDDPLAFPWSRWWDSAEDTGRATELDPRKNAYGFSTTTNKRPLIDVILSAAFKYDSTPDIFLPQVQVNLLGNV